MTTNDRPHDGDNPADSVVLITPRAAKGVDLVALHDRITADLPPGSIVGIPFGETSPTRNLMFWGSFDVPAVTK